MAKSLCAGEAHPLKRAFVVLSAVFFCAGCQSADPLAAFGPYKVPAPNTAQATPYYPPASATAAPATTAATPVPATASKESPVRMSVSAEGPLPQASTTRIAAEPTDREPIRVVENPSAATRTASAPARSAGTPAEAKFTTPSTATAK